MEVRDGEHVKEIPGVLHAAGELARKVHEDRETTQIPYLFTCEVDEKDCPYDENGLVRGPQCEVMGREMFGLDGQPNVTLLRRAASNLLHRGQFKGIVMVTRSLLASVAAPDPVSRPAQHEMVRCVSGKLHDKLMEGGKEQVEELLKTSVVLLCYAYDRGFQVYAARQREDLPEDWNGLGPWMQLDEECVLAHEWVDALRSEVTQYLSEMN